MAFSNMNDVEQELGEEKPPKRGNNRNFLLAVGILGGIIVLVLLVIAGLALFRYLPSQRAAQGVDQTSTAQSASQTIAALSANQTSVAQSAKATNDAKASAAAFAASQTASAPTATATMRPTIAPTNTRAPTQTQAATHTSVVVLSPTTSPTIEGAVATQNALLTQAVQASATPVRPTSTALPQTGIAEDLGIPGLLTAAFVLVVIIFLMRRLRTVS